MPGSNSLRRALRPTGRANSLDDIRNTNAIRQVMMNGRLYDGETLDEVRPCRRPLAPLWWWDDEPEGMPGTVSRTRGRE